MRAPDWLTARPVAHRGLHDATRGIIENTPAACCRGGCGEFRHRVRHPAHADGRSDGASRTMRWPPHRSSGALLGKTSAELRQVVFKDTPERMMSLGELLRPGCGPRAADHRSKKPFDGDRKLIGRMADVLASYNGPAAGMSFDPDQVMALRELIPSRPRGIVANATIPKPTGRRRPRPAPRHAPFASCFPHPAAFRRLWVDELPAAASVDSRATFFGCALLTWTVRTPEQHAIAARHADQMIFDGFGRKP